MSRLACSLARFFWPARGQSIHTLTLVLLHACDVSLLLERCGWQAALKHACKRTLADSVACALSATRKSARAAPAEAQQLKEGVLGRALEPPQRRRREHDGGAEHLPCRAI